MRIIVINQSKVNVNPCRIFSVIVYEFSMRNCDILYDIFS